ncbi:MAG: hypothetical protein NZL95_02405 [Chitinophagales bacterium]|nr:hypothetical protein [Chitinophagales bacterium]MDW8427385.1 hypothetical protein [Chitinophagales bacterium]
MSHSLRIQRPEGAVQGTIWLRGSKSIANRVLLMQALAGTSAHLDNFPDAGDSVLLKKLLDHLEPTIDARDAGTVFRFLTAYLAMQPGDHLLTGTPRMLERPIGDLVEALQALGADITYAGKKGFPPLRIRGRRLRGGSVTVNARISSQFVSALLLIAPNMPDGLILNLRQPPISAPYIDMTIKLMHQFGVEVHQENLTFTVPHQQYHIKDFFIEPDWSSASYLFEIAALASKADVLIPQLSLNSIQGDSAIACFMQLFGVQTEQESRGLRIRKTHEPPTKPLLSFYLSDHPDLAPALFATAAGLSQPTDFTGLHHLMYKESNRAEAFATELRKCNITLEGDGEKISLRGNFVAEHPCFRTYRDHRLALALAPLCLRCQTVTVDDPNVVTKSYPSFWDDLRILGFQIAAA